MILDCDLLHGRDIADARRFTGDDLRYLLAREDLPITGGLLCSLRALTSHAEAGNADTLALCADLPDVRPVYGVDLRDPVGAYAVIDQAVSDDVAFIRLTPERQAIPGIAPRIRRVARYAYEAGRVLLIEGSINEYGSALSGLGARVIWLDMHFYDAGEFIQLCDVEPGFMASTRLLGGPAVWQEIIRSCGVGRLVFGSRPGWFESASGVLKLQRSALSEGDMAAIAHMNLTTLDSGGPQ